MKTMFAVIALALGVLGVWGADPAWADRGSSLFPRPADPWRHWPPSNHGHFRGHGHFHGHGHFRGHVHPPRFRHDGHRGGVGRPHGVPGYWAWNGAGWVWVPWYWR